MGSLCLTFIFLELDLLEVQTSQAMVGTSSRTIASSGKIWGQFGQRLFWEVDVASTEWQDISGLSVYLWFSVTNAIFSNMISTVCIYIYIVAYIQTVPGCFSCAQEAPPRHATSLVSVVSEVQDLYLSCRFFGVKTTHMSWWHGKKGTIFEVHEVSKSRECITYMF